MFFSPDVPVVYVLYSTYKTYFCVSAFSGRTFAPSDNFHPVRRRPSDRSQHGAAGQRAQVRTNLPVFCLPKHGLFGHIQRWGRDWKQPYISFGSGRLSDRLSGERRQLCRFGREGISSGRGPSASDGRCTRRRAGIACQRTHKRVGDAAGSEVGRTGIGSEVM